MAEAPQIQKFAVFDFDGTIIDGDSPVMFVRSLLNRRIMPMSTLAAIGWWGLRYKLRLPHEQCEVRMRIFDLFRGLPAHDVDHMMEYLYATEVSRHLRLDAVAEIRAYQELGIPVVIVSASFEPIVKRAALELGAFAQLSTQMAIENGCYTGDVEGTPVEGTEKFRAFAEYADGFCGKGNWELVAAYSDHYTDEDLLSHAVYPVAVDPDHKLRHIAKKRGWSVAEWR